jgi:hypothetical protein
MLLVSIELCDAGLEAGEQVTRLEVPHVDSGDLGDANVAMGADEGGYGRNGGEGSGEVHGGGCLCCLLNGIREYSVVVVKRVTSVSQ